MLHEQYKIRTWVLMLSSQKAPDFTSEDIGNPLLVLPDILGRGMIGSPPIDELATT
jgi:hypothetical protein